MASVQLPVNTPTPSGDSPTLPLRIFGYIFQSIPLCFGSRTSLGSKNKFPQFCAPKSGFNQVQAKTIASESSLKARGWQLKARILASKNKFAQFCTVPYALRTFFRKASSSKLTAQMVGKLFFNPPLFLEIEATQAPNSRSYQRCFCKRYAANEKPQKNKKALPKKNGHRRAKTWWSNPSSLISVSGLTPMVNHDIGVDNYRSHSSLI